MQPDLLVCLRSWANELTARANRVRALIGNGHWLSDGHHKEYILIEFLSRHLSPRLQIARGFIRPQDGEHIISGEIDILISDFDIHPPWFNEGDLVIVPPASVVAQLHVKTTFGNAEIADVFLSAGRAYVSSESYVDIQRIWSGALFFNPVPMQEPELTECLGSWIGRFVFDWKFGTLLPCHFPNCIAVLGGPIIFFDRTGIAKENIKVRVFDCPDLAPAILLADLFEHIRAHGRETPKRSALTNLLEKVDANILLNETFELKPRRRIRRKSTTSL